MHLFSTPVLAGAALISSPALWMSLLGQIQLEVGLARYLVAVAVSWAALTVVANLVGPSQPIVEGQGQMSETDAVRPGGIE